MVSYLNSKFEKIKILKFLKISAILCFISDITNVIYILTSYLPVNLDKLLLQNPLMNQVVMARRLNSIEIDEFKSLFLNTFSTAFFIILATHLVIYFLLSKNNSWAKRYVSGYSLLGAILTIASIPFMISEYDQWVWSFIMMATCAIYAYIYFGLRFFKKLEQQT